MDKIRIAIHGSCVSRDTFDFDDWGNLRPDTEKNWISINDQPVSYYHLESSTNEDGEYTITGMVPAMLNGQRVNLILIFDSENPKGYVAGAQPAYEKEETDTIARGLIEIQDGDKLDFLCDFYTYDGSYEGNYYPGETMQVEGDLVISDTILGDQNTILMYRFTDMYQQHYFTPVLTETD